MVIGIPDTAARDMADEIAALRSDVNQLRQDGRATQLGRSTLDNGENLLFRNQDGELVGAIGTSSDVEGDPFAIKYLNGPPPSAPALPTLTPGPSVILVESSGEHAAGTPIDYFYSKVYASTVSGFVAGPENFVARLVGNDSTVIGPYPGGTTVYVRMSSVNTSEKEGEASAQVSAVAGLVVAQQVLDGIVNELSLADGAVTEAKHAAGSVTATKIADNSISSPKIIAGGIQAINLAADSVSAGKIAADAITARELQALSVTAGKVAANAITAGTISAGSVTAAKLEATLLMTTRLVVGSLAGARVEIHPTAGLQAFQSNGTTRSFHIDAATGNLTATGVYQSGFSGERIVMLSDGTMRFYGATGTQFCEIRNEAPSGGQAEQYLRLRGYGTGTSTDTMGNLYLAGDNATLTWGSASSAPTTLRLDSGFLQSVASNTVLRTSNLNNALFLGFRNGATSSDISSASLHHKYKSGDPVWGAPGQNVGLLFADGVLFCTDSVGTVGSRRQINASGFIADCTGEAKTNVRELRTSLRGGRRPRDVRVRMRKYQRTEDTVPRPTRPGFQVSRPNPATGREELVDAGWAYPQRPAPTYVGPIAEELEAIDPDLVWRDPATGRLGVPLMSIAGLALEQAGEAHEEIDALRDQLAALTARLDALTRGAR